MFVMLCLLAQKVDERKSYEIRGIYIFIPLSSAVMLYHRDLILDDVNDTVNIESMWFNLVSVRVFVFNFKVLNEFSVVPGLM